MKLIQPFTWRKGIVFSATFLFAILLAACKKEESNIGENNIDQNEILASGGVDTFELNTYSYFDDSVISNITAFAVLGSYVDPVFGKYEAGFYSQFRLDGFAPDFGNLSTVVVDSFVLSLEYIGQYGDSGPQTFEIYELTEDMSVDSTYYAFSSIGANTSFNLMKPGRETLVMNSDSNSPTVVGDDTLSSQQLRIPLHTSKAKSMLIDAMSGNGYFDDNDSFIEYFKGLYIRVNNPSQAKGDGGAFYFNTNDPDSELTIYYTQNGEQKTYSFLMNSSCAEFNRVSLNTDGSGVAPDSLTTTVNGDISYYTQAFGSRAVVEIPGLDNLPATTIIHKAILDLPVTYQTGTNYAPGLDASVATNLEGEGERLFSVNAIAEYDDYRKSFEVDVRNYIQAIVNGEIANTRLIFSPILHNTSAERIIFNGPETIYKNKPKLYILYTEF